MTFESASARVLIVAKQHPIDGQARDKTTLTEKIKELQSELSTLEYRHSDGLIPAHDYSLARARLMEEYDSTLKVLCAVHTGHSASNTIGVPQPPF